MRPHLSFGEAGRGRTGAFANRTIDPSFGCRNGIRSQISHIFLLLCMAIPPLHAQVVSTIPMHLCSSRIDTLVQVRSFNGVAVDDVGYVYLTEWNSGYILKWTPGDTCVQVVESLAERTKTKGTAPEARVLFAHGITADHRGNLYVAEYNGGVIKKIASGGQIKVVAGCGKLCDYGENTPATTAGLSNPNMVIADGDGNLYISDEKNHVVRKVTAEGIMTTYAGTPNTKGYAGDGGRATAALLQMPYGLTLNTKGDLYIADTKNNVVRKVDASGVITTVVGNGQKGYSGDNGPATNAMLHKPMGMTIDGNGNLYIADEENHVIRKVSADGTISTYAGTGKKGNSPDGLATTSYQLNNPRDVAIDRMGTLYVVDFNTDNLRRVHMVTPQAVSEDELVNVTVTGEDELVVNVEKGMFFSASIKDEKNTQVLEMSLTTNPARINIHALAPGNYCLILHRTGHSKTVCFVKSD